jgi:flagellar P-ring protein precursor FlgI
MMRRLFTIAAVATTLVAAKAPAQDVSVADLAMSQQGMPVRLMGYGIVVGLPGTGDRGSVRGSQETVQSIANILRRFGVIVPAEFLRTQNAAAVLVTAEVSPYLRPGGRFEVNVASIGDARSLRGGTLWMTPLVADVGGPAIAGAQGSLLLPLDGQERRTWGSRGTPETGARVVDGGVIEADLPRPKLHEGPARLALRQPSLPTAERMVAAINKEVGRNIATVEDPGSVLLDLSGNDAEKVAMQSRIAAIRVSPFRTNRIVIDARTGAVTLGGDLPLAPGVVSVDGMMLRIGVPTVDTTAGNGRVDLPQGATVRELVVALHAVRAPAGTVASVFESLRRAGVIDAEVVVR